MTAKELLMTAIEEEKGYFDHCLAGTEEYDDSFRRLSSLRRELADLERTEAENERRNRELKDTKKDRIVKNVIEGVKVVGTGIIMPCIGFVVVTAFEKDDSFTSSLKRTLDCFIPKRMN